MKYDFELKNTQIYTRNQFRKKLEIEIELKMIEF